MMYKFNEDNLIEFKKSLDNYKFDLRDENDLYIKPDYNKYALMLNSDWERINNYISYMKKYEMEENKLLYSEDDISLLLGYIDYLRELIKICCYMIQDINKTKSNDLSNVMTKKYVINYLLERQINLFDDYNDLLQEIFNIKSIV